MGHYRSESEGCPCCWPVPNELPGHIKTEADRRKSEQVIGKTPAYKQTTGITPDRGFAGTQPDPLVRRSELSDLCLRNGLIPPADPDGPTHSVDRVMNDVGLLEHDPESYSAGFRAGRQATAEAIVKVVPSYLTDKQIDSVDLPKVPNE